MNKLGFGFLRLPQKKHGSVDYGNVNQMVDIYMEKGIRHFDTCYTYMDGDSELAVKKCVSRRYPREAFKLTDKLPGYSCKKYSDCRKYFNKQLERCGVDYFDTYMLHWLNEENYRIAEEIDEFRFLREVKEEGLAKRIGFSYHGNAKLLDEILCAHPEVDVVLLQINYLDWETIGIESRKCYEVCVKHNKSITVMEPVKGGTLASVPGEAEGLMKSAHPDWSPADWAIRFAQSLPKVDVVLSGMNDVSQVEANTKQVEPLAENDIKILEEVRKIIEQNTAVPCTGCRYCEPHCPKKIVIADYFKIYNELSRFPDEGWKIRPVYNQLASENPNPSDCISCRSCEKYCPQQIKISEIMKEIN